MFVDLACSLASVPALISLATEDDLRSLHDYLDGDEVSPAGSSQAFLFRVVDDMRAKGASRADLAGVRNLIEGTVSAY